MNKLSVLCRRPDGRGAFSPRCQHIIERPRDQDEPRQCRRAASRGINRCEAHSHKTTLEGTTP